MPRQDRDFFPASADVGERTITKVPPPVELKELLLALKDVLKRADLFGRHNISREALSVRQRMTDVLAHLEDHEFHLFESLFTVEEGRLGIVVTFLAILELAKENLLDITQNDAFAQIYVRTRTVTAEAEAEAEIEAES